jgi:GNAT superfamily N-acetyltransferase
MPLPMSLTFAAMQPEHLPGAVRLSADAGWPHREEDWRLILDISHGFVAVQEGEVVATALATPFGNAAMVNMVIVDASLRRKGIARVMMERVMAVADPASWHLVATDAGLPLYEAFGFRRTGKIVRYQGNVADVRSSGDACWGSTSDLAAVIRLDKAASGMDRAAMYSALSKEARIAVLRRSDGIVGHAFVRDFGRGRVVGPVVASSVGAAQSLISFIMSEDAGALLRVDTGVHTGLGAWLERNGLSADTAGGIVMQAGTVASGPTGPVSVFALAAQALG